MASTSNVTLDDLELVDAPSSGIAETGDNGSMDIDTHLSYPTYTVEEQQELLRQYDAQHDGSFEPVPSQPVKALLKDRLYVGNLHPTVDEYALLHVFSKFGKVTKLDFLFHKAGPMKGKPRGYAFIEYGTQEEAQKALSIAHGKLLRGRKLVVTYAQQAPLDQYPGGGGTYNRRPMMETGRPTTLSLIKTGLAHRHEPKTADKIRLMEAKLQQLSGSSDPLSPSASLQGSNTLPHHPSLPAKPPPALPAHLAQAIRQSQASSSTSTPGSRNSNSPSGTPRLPQKPQAATPTVPTPFTLPSRPFKPSQTSLPLKPGLSRASSGLSTPLIKSGGSSKGLLPNLPLPPKPGGVSVAAPPTSTAKVSKPKLAGVVLKPKVKKAVASEEAVVQESEKAMEGVEVDQSAGG